jgi:polyisoprenoid-binding protein YceI
MHMQLEVLLEDDELVLACHDGFVAIDPDDPQAARLKAAVRAFRRSKMAHERDRLELREAILDASKGGKGTTEITKLIDREYTEAHVSRMINGKA